MFDKKFYFALAIVIGLFLMVSVAMAAETTRFNTDFMEGSFVGDVDLESGEKGIASSYVDEKNGITYNISTVDDTESLMKVYAAQGVSDPTEVTLNGNDWNVYFADGVSENPSNKGDEMNIIFCQSQGEKQGYMIYVIIDGDSDYADSEMDATSETYLKFVKPLLKSITLKESGNVPKINEAFGLSEDEFQQKLDELSSMT